MTSEWIGRYRIVRPLGEGGMGRVLLAEVAGAGGFARRVVLKLVRDELDEGLKQALLDEAKLTATLVHRNIVPVLDLQETGAQRLVVLEHVDGLDLQRLLAQVRQLPWPLAVFVAGEVAAGLDYAHRKHDAAGRALQIVHRDVSPANILVSWEGEVKLADFGIAKVARAEALQGPWVTAGLKGNLGYMAPEQEARQPVDPRSDLFSLGIVLFELVTGERARDGDRLRGRAALPPLPPRLAPPELAAIVERATALRADERFASAALLRQALMHLPGQAADPARELAQFLAPLKPRVGLDGDALVAAALGDKPATRAALRATRRRRRWRWPLLVGATLATTGLAVVASVRLQRHRAAPPVVAAPAPSPPPLPVTAPVAAAPPARCRLAITSSPAGARIAVDGHPGGRAPALLTLGCRAAPYRVTLSAHDWSLWERRVTLERADSAITATLVRRGSLSINAIPWAQIFVDGAPAGHTPRLRLPLDAGRHQLRLVTQAGDARSRTVEIVPGRDTKVTVAFSEP